MYLSCLLRTMGTHTALLSRVTQRLLSLTDCLYEIICSLPLLEELDGHEVTDTMRRRAHDELGLEFVEAVAQVPTAVGGDGHQEVDPGGAHGAGSNDGGEDATRSEVVKTSDNGTNSGSTSKRLSAAAAALRKITYQEEVDIYQTAADLARQMGASALNAASDGEFIESADATITKVSSSATVRGAQSPRDGWQGALVANAVADAEIAVQETSKRIIHASKMRAEEYKQLDQTVSNELSNIVQST